MAPKIDVWDEKNKAKSQGSEATFRNLKQCDEFGSRLPHEYRKPDAQRVLEKLLPVDEKR